MPVLNSEVCFEQLSDRIPAEIPRLMFWASMLNGAAGHTYGANGIWQCNRAGQPHGASPHGGNYGKITWNEAMKLPGGRQVGQGRKFLESFGWERFEPQSKFVMWTGNSSPEHWGNWIWFPEGDPKTDAPVAARFFRKTFEVPTTAEVEHATLFISTDDKFEAWLNGRSLGSSADWHAPKRFEIRSLLKPGQNLLAVRAENAPASVKSNPAGLIVSMEVSLKDGSKRNVVSDETWRASKTGPELWASRTYDDSAWPQAQATARYGEGPWGKLSSSDEAVVPFASGIGETIRIIYAPDPRPVQLSHLRTGAKYRMKTFDPVTGERGSSRTVTADAEGNLKLDPPPTTHDWVVALELSNLE